MRFEVQDYPDREILVMDLADRLADDLADALHGGGRVSFAVPGGTTPGPVFDALSAVRLDWSRVDVMLSDERWVPEEDPRSNTGLLRGRLLRNWAAEARLLPLYAPGHSPQEALPELESLIAPALPLSVLLLGMGADMHTASLFPGADLLSAALAPDAPILLPITAPGAPEPRVTLSARVLNAALRKHVVIFGSEKRKALEQARRLPHTLAPVAAVLDGATVHWAE